MQGGMMGTVWRGKLREIIWLAHWAPMSSNSNIDFEPNEINHHFGASVNNRDVLDNSDIPSGHIGDGEFTFDEVGQFGILDALKSISINACEFDGVLEVSEIDNWLCDWSFGELFSLHILFF
jgi:hypothetical protein